MVSCGIGKVHHVGTDIIPAKFEYKETTLLVEELPRAGSANKKVEQLLQKKYPYKYQFAQSKDILASNKFVDSTKFRYAIMSDIGPTTLSREDGTRMSHTVIDYHIYDRLTKKHYPPTGYSASLAKLPFETLLNTLLIAIEEKK